MKQKLKQITKFMAICALLSLGSCEKDLYEEGLKDNGKSKISTMNLTDLPFLKTLIENKKKENKASNKEGEIDYLKYIKTDNIYVITGLDGLKTYTFGLNFEELNKLTNVLLKKLIKK